LVVVLVIAGVEGWRLSGMVLVARHVKPGLRNERLGYIMGVEGCKFGGICLKPQGLLILILLGAGWLVTTGLTKLLVFEGTFLLLIHLRLELLVIRLVLWLVKLLFVPLLLLLRLVILLLVPVLLLFGLIAVVLLGG